MTSSDLIFCIFLFTAKKKEEKNSLFPSYTLWQFPTLRVPALI